MPTFRRFAANIIMLINIVLPLAISTRVVEEQYYNVCINFLGLNTDYQNCRYAAPHENYAMSRDIILPRELRRLVVDWCSITSPWQRECFRRVTWHCDNAANLAELADTSGLCNGTRPAHWVHDVIRHFPGVDRTCLDFLPDVRPLVAEDAEDIRMFKKIQRQNFDAYLVNIWFSAMESDCQNKDALFHYRMIQDLLTSDLGVNYINQDNVF